MNNLILFSFGLIVVLFIPCIIWRIKISKEYVKYLPIEEKDLDYLNKRTPIFTKYWISNSLYKDYIDKTRISLNGENDRFDFAKCGIALKLDVYSDTIVLSNLGGIFIKKRAIILGNISKIYAEKQIVGFKGANFKFIANNFSKKQIEQLKGLK